LQTNCLNTQHFYPTKTKKNDEKQKRKILNIRKSCKDKEQGTQTKGERIPEVRRNGAH
jgi:hypothetical protein